MIDECCVNYIIISNLMYPLRSSIPPPFSTWSTVTHTHVGKVLKHRKITTVRQRINPTHVLMISSIARINLDVYLNKIKTFIPFEVE